MTRAIAAAGDGLSRVAEDAESGADAAGKESNAAEGSGARSARQRAFAAASECRVDAHDDAHLSDAAAEVQRLGWLFGVCAAGFGADTLVERVERDGVSDVLAWAADTVRRAGRELVFVGADGLTLAAPSRIAPRLAFALAFGSASAALARPVGASTRVEFVVGPSHALVRFDVCLDEVVATWLAALGGTLRSETGASEWVLPPSWLATRNEGAS